MELDGLRVNHQGLDQLADDLMNVVNRIDARMTHLDEELVPLRSDWVGEAKVGLHGGEGALGHAINEMRDLLRITSHQVTQANAEYRAADARGAHVGSFGVDEVPPGWAWTLPHGSWCGSRSPRPTRRVDLSPCRARSLVAELVPRELARSVGLLDSRHGAQGLPPGHSTLAAPSPANAGLLGPGGRGRRRHHGGGRRRRPFQPPVYDDEAEAVADVVERDLEPWDAATARRTALVAAVSLLLTAAGGLALQRGSGFATGAAVGVSVGLVLGSVAVSRVRGETWTPRSRSPSLGCVPTPRSPAGGSPRAHPLVATPFAAAGAGALAAGLVAALGLAEGRVLLLPPVVTGAVLLATGPLTRATSYRPGGAAHRRPRARGRSPGRVFPALALASIRCVGRPTRLGHRTDRRLTGRPPTASGRRPRFAHENPGRAVTATVGAAAGARLAPLAVSLEYVARWSRCWPAWW